MVNELKDLSRIDVFKSILKNNKEMTLSLFGLFLCIFVYGFINFQHKTFANYYFPTILYTSILIYSGYKFNLICIKEKLHGFINSKKYLILGLVLTYAIMFIPFILALSFILVVLSTILLFIDFDIKLNSKLNVLVEKIYKEDEYINSFKPSLQSLVLHVDDSLKIEIFSYSEKYKELSDYLQNYKFIGKNNHRIIQKIISIYLNEKIKAI